MSSFEKICSNMALVVGSLYFIDVILIKYLFCSPLLVMQESLRFSYHSNIQIYTSRRKKMQSFIFFRHLYFCKKSKSVTKFYLNKCTNVNSFMSKTQKNGLIKSLLFRCFSYIWKDILYKNGYTHDFVDKCIKEIFELVLTSKINLSKVP